MSRCPKKVLLAHILANKTEKKTAGKVKVSGYDMGAGLTLLNKALDEIRIDSPRCNSQGDIVEFQNFI